MRKAYRLGERECAESCMVIGADKAGQRMYGVDEGWCSENYGRWTGCVGASAIAACMYRCVRYHLEKLSLPWFSWAVAKSAEISAMGCWVLCDNAEVTACALGVWQGVALWCAGTATVLIRWELLIVFFNVNFVRPMWCLSTRSTKLQRSPKANKWPSVIGCVICTEYQRLCCCMRRRPQFPLCWPPESDLQSTPSGV